ncbi:hypothetical protein LQW06_000505 [Listeria monocytogenes]|nr:hypothetical protein [Listeria monocytogenes]
MEYKYFNKLEKYMNNKGITNDSELNIGELTLSGSSLSRKEFPNNKLEISKIPFKLKLDSKFDNLKMMGEIIEVNEKNVESIYLLGCSIHGDIKEKIIVETEQEVFEWEVLIYDIANNLDSEKLSGFFMTCMNTVNGRSELLKPKLSIYEFNLNEKKDIIKIKLPFNPFGHIFAITFREGMVSNV